MIVRNIPRHFVAPLSERGGCRVIPAQIVLFVAIADNHINFLEFIEVAKVILFTCLPPLMAFGEAV